VICDRLEWLPLSCSGHARLNVRRSLLRVSVEVFLSSPSHSSFALEWMGEPTNLQTESSTHPPYFPRRLFVLRRLSESFPIPPVKPPRVILLTGRLFFLFFFSL
jgi:hypothetical protein